MREDLELGDDGIVGPAEVLPAVVNVPTSLLSVLPRRARRDEELPEAEILDAAVEGCAVKAFLDELTDEEVAAVVAGAVGGRCANLSA